MKLKMKGIGIGTTYKKNKFEGIMELRFQNFRQRKNQQKAKNKTDER